MPYLTRSLLCTEDIKGIKAIKDKIFSTKAKTLNGEGGWWWGFKILNEKYEPLLIS